MTWWWQLVSYAGGLAIVLGLAVALNGVIHRMWSSNRKFARFLDQMLGDKTAVPPVPGVMDQLKSVLDKLDEQDKAIKSQDDAIRRQAQWQIEHDRAHANGRTTQTQRRRSS